jgi:hypothetical protein
VDDSSRQHADHGGDDHHCEHGTTDQVRANDNVHLRLSFEQRSSGTPEVANTLRRSAEETVDAGVVGTGIPGPDTKGLHIHPPLSGHPQRVFNGGI